MIPDIVEIKRLCASGQWNTKLKNGKILLHDTVSGETVCIGNVDTVEEKHGRWEQGYELVRGMEDNSEVPYVTCSICGQKEYGADLEDYTDYDDLPNFCPHCGAKMDGGVE